MVAKRRLGREKNGRYFHVGLPADLVEIAGIAEDDEVELRATPKGIRIMKVRGD